MCCTQMGHSGNITVSNLSKEIEAKVGKIGRKSVVNHIMDTKVCDDFSGYNMSGVFYKNMWSM